MILYEWPYLADYSPYLRRIGSSFNFVLSVNRKIKSRPIHMSLPKSDFEAELLSHHQNGSDLISVLRPRVKVDTRSKTVWRLSNGPLELHSDQFK